MCLKLLLSTFVVKVRGGRIRDERGTMKWEGGASRPKVNLVGKAAQF